MQKNIAVIRGDGIGPEIVEQALLVLDTIAEKFGHKFIYTDVDMGGCAIDKWGNPLPEEMLEKCKDLSFAENGVRILSAVNDDSMAQISALAEELSL